MQSLSSFIYLLSTSFVYGITYKIGWINITAPFNELPLSTLDHNHNIKICETLLDLFAINYLTASNQCAKKIVSDNFQLTQQKKNEFYVFKDNFNLEITNLIWKPCKSMIYDQIQINPIDEQYTKFSLLIKLTPEYYEFYIKPKTGCIEIPCMPSPDPHTIFMRYFDNDTFAEYSNCHKAVDLFGVYMDSAETLWEKEKIERIFGFKQLDTNNDSTICKWLVTTAIHDVFMEHTMNIYQKLFTHDLSIINDAAIDYEKRTFRVPSYGFMVRQPMYFDTKNLVIIRDNIDDKYGLYVEYQLKGLLQARFSIYIQHNSTYKYGLPPYELQS